ncbi:MAG: TauD/TfdA family dioxygenase [Pseudomonadota bacterium]
MTTAWQTIEVHPVSAALGAEISGVNIAGGVSEQQFAELRQAFAEYGVIFFRDQSISPEQHLAFAERWGEINVNRFFNAVDGYPQIAEVRKEPEHKTNVGANWHTDHSYDQIPAMGSLLYAREVPSSGGDTLFASMYAAHDALSGGLRETLSHLRAVHSTQHVFGEGGYTNHDERYPSTDATVKEATHPVIIRHPLSARPALYVNGNFTVQFEGWSRDESRPLLDFLCQHACRDEFTCRFQWQVGSMAIWDNRATHHRALNDYPGERRVMHRVTVAGEALLPALTAATKR